MVHAGLDLLTFSGQAKNVPLQRKTCASLKTLLHLHRR